MSAGPGFATLIGVGNMGGAMAAHLLESGWQVQVCDLDAERTQALATRGATVADSPRGAARLARNASGFPGAFIVCVVDAAQADAVVFGPDGLEGELQRGDAVVLCPTMAPEDVQEIARRLLEQGVHTIDAPMSGGPARARDGSMSLMVACVKSVFAQHEALLTALSNQIFRISERPGDGARTKLVNNLLAGINLVGAAEALALAQRLGLDAGKTLAVIEHSSGQSWIGSDRMRRALRGDYAPRAHVSLLEKDTRLAVKSAQQAGFDGPLGVHARDVFAQASEGGLANLDDAALYQWLSRL
jgi:putative dehydrogenase